MHICWNSQAFQKRILLNFFKNFKVFLVTKNVKIFKAAMQYFLSIIPLTRFPGPSYISIFTWIPLANIKTKGEMNVACIVDTQEAPKSGSITNTKYRGPIFSIKYPPIKHPGIAMSCDIDAEIKIKLYFLCHSWNCQTSFKS